VFADGEIGVLGKLDGNYTRVFTEIMALPGVVSVGLLQDVATIVAIVDGSNVRLFRREELVAAVEVAAEQAADGGSATE
jgi:hypothetical protein